MTGDTIVALVNSITKVARKLCDLQASKIISDIQVQSPSVTDSPFTPFVQDDRGILYDILMLVINPSSLPGSTQQRIYDCEIAINKIAIVTMKHLVPHIECADARIDAVYEGSRMEIVAYLYLIANHNEDLIDLWTESISSYYERITPDTLQFARVYRRCADGIRTAAQTFLMFDALRPGTAVFDALRPGTAVFDALDAPSLACPTDIMQEKILRRCMPATDDLPPHIDAGNCMYFDFAFEQSVRSAQRDSPIQGVLNAHRMLAAMNGDFNLRALFIEKINQNLRKMAETDLLKKSSQLPLPCSDFQSADAQSFALASDFRSADMKHQTVKFNVKRIISHIQM